MWHRLDPAQGTVTVPDGTSVLLHIGSDDPGDLRALGKFGGDGLQALCLAGNGAVDDPPSVTSVV
jgi:hypothetical protein